MNTIIKAFANSVAEIDTARITKSTFTYNDFVNNIDQLLWIALDKGDVVPDIYVRIIDQALNDLSCKYKGKYLTNYLCAVSLFEKNKECDKASDFVCTPEYLGQKSEESFYFENVSEDEYEANS